MEFNGFRVLPMEGRSVEPAEQEAVGQILLAEQVLECIPRGPEVLVEIGHRIPSGLTLASAHNEWSESYFPNLDTPPRLPRQPLHVKTPRDLVLVTISVIDKHTPGMGSHFGFTGYFLSLLMSLCDRVVWDARGERVT